LIEKVRYMAKGYCLQEDIIVIDRDLTELDLFVKDFLNILKRYSDYLIVSGFVSISTGRARGTEDVDILVPKMEEHDFEELFNDLQKNNFWCYQSDDPREVYQYIKDMQNIRFARKNEIFPNVEFVPINEKKKIQFFEFTHPQKVRVKDFEFKIPPLEFEILYKEKILGSKKDKEDAKHLRIFFSNILSKDKFDKYEKIIRGN